jgi:hypothetical protein
MDEHTRVLLERAVKSRLDRQRQQIIAAIEDLPATKAGGFEHTKTWLDTGLYSGDVQVSWTAVTINNPYTMQFRWRTEEADAETGTWGLFREGSQGEQLVLLQTGSAGDAPAGLFEINLGKYLPPTPPDVPTVYRVEVQPATKMRYAPGATAALPGKKILGEAVGLPSNPVWITYTSVQPDPPFKNFRVLEVFRTLDFHMGSINMREASQEVGAEQFFTTGFIQEYFTSGPGDQVSDLGGFAELGSDGPWSAQLGGLARFRLNNPDQPEWPRAYILVMSVLEHDDGGALDEWSAMMANLAWDFLYGAVRAEVTNYLEQVVNEYLGETLDDFNPNVPDFTSITTMIILNVASSMGAMVAVASAAVAFYLIFGISDDYYGTDASVLFLPSNIAEVVARIPGDIVPGIGYRFRTDPMKFMGPPAWLGVSSTDGCVEIDFKWDASGAELW